MELRARETDLTGVGSQGSIRDGGGGPRVTHTMSYYPLHSLCFSLLRPFICDLSDFRLAWAVGMAIAALITDVLAVAALKTCIDNSGMLYL